MASERDQASDGWKASRRSVKNADRLFRRAAAEIITMFNRTAARIGPVTVSNRQQYMQMIDPIIWRYFGGHGVNPYQSELYRMIRRQSELTFLNIYRNAWREIDTIMVDNPRDWAIIRQFLRSAPLDDADGIMTAYRVLYGPHIERQRLLNAKLFDPQRNWVDPRGYKLSTRLWRNGDKYRAGIDRVLQEGIQRGEAADKLADRLDHYLNPDHAPLEYSQNGKIVRKNMTSKPYGARYGHGSTYARQLARTEINRVHGESTKQRAEDVPSANGIKWRLSAQHPEIDICDEHATANLFDLGPGIYPIPQVPTYPAHPNCMCTLVTQHRPRAEVRGEIGERYRDIVHQRVQERLRARDLANV